MSDKQLRVRKLAWALFRLEGAIGTLKCVERDTLGLLEHSEGIEEAIDCAVKNIAYADSLIRTYSNFRKTDV